MSTSRQAYEKGLSLLRDGGQSVGLMLFDDYLICDNADDDIVPAKTDCVAHPRVVYVAAEGVKMTIRREEIQRHRLRKISGQ